MIFWSGAGWRLAIDRRGVCCVALGVNGGWWVGGLMKVRSSASVIGKREISKRAVGGDGIEGGCNVRAVETIMKRERWKWKSESKVCSQPQAEQCEMLRPGGLGVRAGAGADANGNRRRSQSTHLWSGARTDGHMILSQAVRARAGTA